jgi:hypothetical protein
MASISSSAGSVVKLRAYDERAMDIDPRPEYRNVLIFQARLPAASPSYAQPPVNLAGGGNVDISGTIYAPKALVAMIGNAGGSGGDTSITVQFISWDLSIQGNAAFTFFYSAQDFAFNTMYGLVE